MVRYPPLPVRVCAGYEQDRPDQPGDPRSVDAETE